MEVLKSFSASETDLEVLNAPTLLEALLLHSIVVCYELLLAFHNHSVIAQFHDGAALTRRQLSLNTAEATRAHLSEATKSVATCNSLNNLCTLAAN